MWRPVPPAAVIACLRGRFAVLLITSCALALALTGGLILASSPTASAKGAALLTSSQAEPVAGGDQCEAPNWRAIAAQREAQRRFLVNNGGFGVAGSAGVTLAFMPGPVRTPRPLLLEDLQRQQGFATGLLSATIGRYSPAQMMLDISQGTRVASGLYRPSAPPVPAMALGQFGAGRIVGWEGYRARAADAPGELLPGLMAESVIGRGGSVSYVGTAGGSNTAAMAAAAGQCGILQSVSLGPQATLTARAEAAQGSSALTVVALPPGGYGVGALESLARTAPKRMIIVVQAPPDPARNRLLPLAVRGLGGDGGLKSPTTRRTGLVTGTDIAPTVLKQLGIVPPREMDGRPIEAASAMDAEQLEAMSDRLSLISGRRLPLGKGVALMFLLIFGAVMLMSRASANADRPKHLAMRLIALAMLWLPLMLLVTAALRPSGSVELDIAVAGSLGLALLVDRLVKWPCAPAIPVLAMVIGYGLDFALGGSLLTGQSLFGSNPFYGARFYGAGNELEAVVVVTGLLGTGSLACWIDSKNPLRVFAAAGVAFAMFLGLGSLGADVGGVIMVSAGFGIAALHASGKRLTVRRAAFLALLPVVGLALVIVLDKLSGSQSHLTRTILHAESGGDLLNVVVRRFSASINGALIDRVWIVVLAAIGLLAWAWLRRDRLLAPLHDPPTGATTTTSLRPIESALIGGIAATIVGTFANDSGPAILVIGTSYLGIGVLYVRGKAAGSGPTRSRG